MIYRHCLLEGHYSGLVSSNLSSNLYEFLAVQVHALLRVLRVSPCVRHHAAVSWQVLLGPLQDLHELLVDPLLRGFRITTQPPPFL